MKAVGINRSPTSSWCSPPLDDRSLSKWGKERQQGDALIWDHLSILLRFFTPNCLDLTLLTSLSHFHKKTTLLSFCFPPFNPSIHDGFRLAECFHASPPWCSSERFTFHFSLFFIPKDPDPFFCLIRAAGLFFTLPPKGQMDFFS